MVAALAVSACGSSAGSSGSPAGSGALTTGAAVTTVPAGDGSLPCPALDGSSAKPASFARPPSQQCTEPGAAYSAVVTTNFGAFTIELAADTSPITVDNFVMLARYHYYDGTGCHRVIAGFVVQCGRPGADESAPGYTIPDELPTLGEYAEGVVAMANTGVPDSGGGQWFIITGAAGASLPPQYSIVGKVVDGYATTVKTLEAQADPAQPNGVPTLAPIEITSVVIAQS